MSSFQPRTHVTACSFNSLFEMRVARQRNTPVEYIIRFNFLFEMHWYLGALSRVENVRFNSLFEMRPPVRALMPGMCLGLCFNSLFEMRRRKGRRRLESDRQFQFSV